MSLFQLLPLLLFFVTSMYGFSNGAANRKLRLSTSMIVTEDISIPSISDLYIRQYVSRDVSYLHDEPLPDNEHPHGDILPRDVL